MPILSTADFKTLRGISATTWDAQLNVIIPHAQSLVENYCGRAFDSATYTSEKYDGSGSEILILRQFPVTTLTSVSISGVAVASTSYTLDAANGIVKFEPSGRGRVVVDPDWLTVQTTDYIGPFPCWPEGHQNISVTYTAGYTSGTMPGGLKLAFAEFVDMALAKNTLGVGSSQYKSEKLGDYQYDRGVPEQPSATLERLFSQYRRISL